MSLIPADSPEVVARVNEELDLVDIVSRQLWKQLGLTGDLDDLRSAGREGLLHAARTFDPARGVPFRRWANLRIRGAIIDALRQAGNVPRRVHARLRAIEAGDRMQEGLDEDDAASTTKDAADADHRLGTYLAGIATAMAVGFLVQGAGVDPEAALDPNETPEEQLARAQLMALVRSAIEEQPEAERHLLKRHYFDGLQFDEAAKELGLSKSWASRIHTRAIEQLARAMKRARVER